MLFVKELIQYEQIAERGFAVEDGRAGAAEQLVQNQKIAHAVQLPVERSAVTAEKPVKDIDVSQGGLVSIKHIIIVENPVENKQLSNGRARRGLVPGGDSRFRSMADLSGRNRHGVRRVFGAVIRIEHGTVRTGR